MESIQISLGSIKEPGKLVSNGLTMVLVLRGGISLKSPGQNRNLTGNHFAVLNHNDIYTLESSGPNVFLWVNLGRSWLESICPEAVSRRIFCCSTVSNPATEPLYQLIRQGLTRSAILYYRRESGYRILMQAELLRVLHTLFLHFQTGEQRAAGKEAFNSMKVSQRLKPVLEYIGAHFRESLSLEDAAAHVYVSPAHLARLFKKELQVTFVQYLTALRLEAAREMLLDTADPLIHVALNCGFANTKALSQYFQRAYGCTPAQYRKEAEKRPPNARIFWLEANQDGSLENLVRFVETYERHPNSERHEAKPQLGGEGKRLGLPELILHAGSIFQAQREDVRRQIREAKERIHFKYIQLSGLFAERGPGVSMLEQLDELELLSEILHLGLIPMVEVDPQKEKNQIAEELERLCARFGGRELSRWKFFLKGPGEEAEVFIQVAAVLRKRIPGVQVGVHIDLDHPEPWMGNESFGGQIKMPADFFTCCSDPNGKLPQGDAFSYERFQKRYHQNQLNRMYSFQESHHCRGPVYLLSWNTLTGRSIVESGSFHRTALILDTILMLRNEAAGFGIHLNLRSGSTGGPEHLTYPLSLYLYQNIKRPLFFVLQWLSNLGDTVLWEENGRLITTMGPGEYRILLWHPCYTDPILSLDDFQGEAYSQKVHLMLKELPPGNYRIKRLLLDKDNGSTYRSWLKIDMSAPLDQDVLDYLGHASNPSVTMEHRQAEEGIEVVQNLSMNAAAMWSLSLVETQASWE